MRVLITGASSLLGRTLAEVLGATHRLRLIDTVPVSTTAEFCQGDLRDTQVVFRACDGIEAVVHLCELPARTAPEDEWEQEIVDLATRGTSTLFRAAVDAGAKSGVFIGTMKMFLKYPEDCWITEYWKPRPDPDDPFQLAKFLGELTAREFARAEPISILCLRVGNVVLEDACQGQPFDPLWVDARDVSHAVASVLSYPMSSYRQRQRWFISHLNPDMPKQRFPYNPNYGSFLGIRPVYNFKAWEAKA